MQEMEPFPRTTKSGIQKAIDDDKHKYGKVSDWTLNMMAANGYTIDAGKNGELVKDNSGKPEPPLLPAKAKAAKPAAQKKPSIQSELAAAKKQAAKQQKSAPSKTLGKTKSQGMEV